MTIAKSCLSRKDWWKGRLSCWWTVCYVGEQSAMLVNSLLSWWMVCFYGERCAKLVKGLHLWWKNCMEFNYLFPHFSTSFLPVLESSTSVDKGDKEEKYSTTKTGSTIQKTKQAATLYTTHTHLTSYTP